MYANGRSHCTCETMWIFCVCVTIYISVDICQSHSHTSTESSNNSAHVQRELPVRFCFVLRFSSLHFHERKIFRGNLLGEAGKGSALVTAHLLRPKRSDENRAHDALLDGSAEGCSILCKAVYSSVHSTQSCRSATPSRCWVAVGSEEWQEPMLF